MGGVLGGGGEGGVVGVGEAGAEGVDVLVEEKLGGGVHGEAAGEVLFEALALHSYNMMGLWLVLT